MKKVIHVNGYVKSDGTEVKEHYRNIETVDNGFVANQIPIPPIFQEHKYDFPEKEKPVIMNANKSSLVLSGGISEDVELPGGGNDSGGGEGAGEVAATVISIGLQVASLALQIYEAMNSANSVAVEYLKPQLANEIKKFDTHVSNMKLKIDSKVKELANTNNKKEYPKLYDTLQKEYQTYNQAKIC